MMQVTNAKYIAHITIDGTKTGDMSAIQTTIDGTEMFVPLDPSNRHYAEIMRQVEAGELTIEDAD